MPGLRIFKKPDKERRSAADYIWLIAKLTLALAILALSIKPFLFTLNFIPAVLHLEKDESGAGPYIATTLSHKPSAYKIFAEYHPLAVERCLVKSAVYAADTRLLDSPPGGIDVSRVHVRFKDNFYLQHLLGNLDQDRDWENLDPVSFQLLADAEMNPLFSTIFEKINTRFSRPFVENLADFLAWKGNTQLCRYLVSRYPGGRVPFRSGELRGRDIDAATARLKAVLLEKYRAEGAETGKNLVRCPGFTDPAQVEAHWYFSNQAGKAVFSRASFVMGVDNAAGNPVMRLMGFFTTHEKGESRPRAGARYRQKIPAENGFYVLGFDYCTATGKEAPSFWLANGLPEQHLHPTREKWQKVIFILDNSANTYKTLNPLVRMWGTGTLLVDNVFLAKMKNPAFSIPRPYERFVEK